MTLWITWIVCSIVFAVLFSVIKTLDRLRYAVELLDARVDQMGKNLDVLVALAGQPASHQLANSTLPASTERRH